VIIRREAEGSIYTGKCQGTKQWPILPHHSRNLILVEFGRNLILVEFGRNLRLVEFSRILRLVELSRLFRYRVDISRNFRLVDPSGFFGF